MSRLQKCRLCENLQDPRFSVVINHVLLGLCDGCAPGLTEEDRKRVFAKILATFDAIQVGALVRLARQPGDLQHLKLVGEVGFIKIVYADGRHVEFRSLKRDGTYGGGGMLPRVAFEPEDGEEWKVALAKYHENEAKLTEQGRAWNERFHERLRELSVKHGLSVSRLEEIHGDVERVIARAGWP